MMLLMVSIKQLQSRSPKKFVFSGAVHTSLTVLGSFAAFSFHEAVAVPARHRTGAACATLWCPVWGAAIMEKSGETEAGRAFPSPVQNIPSFKGRPGSPGPFDYCFARMAAGKKL